MVKDKVIIYLRLSEEDGDGESMSITNQRKTLYEYAAKNNMEIVDEYIDDGVSGYLWSRPSFNRLKRDLNENKVNTILVKDLSRIGRHNAKVQLFLENILEDGKRIIAILDPYDTLDERSHDTVGIHTWANEHLVKQTSKKVRATLHNKQKEGTLLISAPYGYYKDRLDKTKCHIDNDVAPYVRLIFDSYINGKGVKEIARILNDNNIPTPTQIRKQYKEARGEVSKLKVSGVWDTSVIIKILKNEFYIGTLVLNKTKTRSIHGKKIDVDPDEHIKFPNHHEPIIDRHTFQLAQELRTKRRCDHFRGQKSKVRKNLFAGIIYCADCGAILTTSGHTSNTRYICKTYNVFGTSKCSSHAIMENDILEVLFELIEHCRDNLKEVLDDLNNIIQAELKVRGKKDDTYDIVKMLENKKKELEVLIELKIKETVKNPSMSDIIERTYAEMQNGKYKEIQSLEKQISDQQDISIDESKMKDDVNMALSIMNDILSTKNVTKKQILMLIDKIIVHADSGIDILLKGDLHKLSNNYFKVNETRINKIKKYLCEFIEANPEKFTKDECTVYVKDKGVKVHYKIISKIINEELGDMVELREMRHGYRLIAPIEDVKRVLLSNIVDSTIGCLHYNNEENEKHKELFNIVGGSTESLHYNNDKISDNIVNCSTEYLHYNSDIFAILVEISNWINGINYSKKKNLF